MSTDLIACSAKTPISLGHYGAAFNDVTIVWMLMQGDVNNPSLDEQ